MTSLPPVPAARLRALAPWAVGLLAIVVYANALHNGFALDDEGIIVRSDVVHHLSGVWRAFVTPYWPNGAGQYRPLVIASFSLEWAAWSTQPHGYHALNLLWHAAASVLVYAFLRRWLSVGGSAIAAALFAVHPVHVEAVSNIVGRAELMAACGILATLILHARRSPWAVVTFALALLSKEHALLAPVLAGGLDLVDPEPPDRDDRDGSKARARRRRLLSLYAAYAGVAVLWGGAVAWNFRGRPFAAVDPFWTTIDARTRVLTVLGIVPTWVRLWFFPHDLSSDYSPRVIDSWPANAPAALLGASILLFACALVLALRRRSRPALIAVAWMAITMLPVANLLVPTGVIVGERTLYLSSVGAVMLLGLGLEWMARSRLTVALAATGAMMLAAGVRTWTRTPVWRSNRALFLETIRAHPEASWTHVLLARVYVGNGGLQDALREYRIALAMFDRNPVTVAEAIYAAGRAREYAFADSVVAHAQLTLKSDYLLDVAHSYIAFEQHRYAESLRAAQQATAPCPSFREATSIRLLSALRPACARPTRKKC